MQTTKTLVKPKKSPIRYLLLPAVIFVAVVTQIPFLMTIIISFLKWNVKRPDIPVTFAGFDNYAYIFTDSKFYSVLINSLVQSAVSLVLCTVLGFLLALLFSKSFKGINIARSFIIVPYFVMESVTGIIWKTLMLSPSFGINMVLSKWIGIEPVAFFSSQLSLVTIIILIVWQWTPFLFMILLAGLQNLSEDVLESAKIDGAHGLKLLYYIKIPMLKSYFEVGMMFGLINILKVFGLVFVTTQGGPGVSSANLPYYVYRTAFYDWQMGRSAAIAVITVAITLIVIQSFFNLIRRRQKGVA
ncbi:carbohydrate ABC transporter membrane protein 1 (CUT1 family) [Anaerobacterium chartisolvens]|uniref:Carbohydrate ABC transporter membrane protein 1 (CUT1 family) n=1 Tax=Anaerobacterium chartisolvens TaxID=1297424 RepID=A0A369B470_9FIRM|nr:sugar ABC transporter permease [Anaerobacterium chartisolvens]RCX16105.1 carbohydrate ABC transporter membrane protein 1 (CUT1 family) [Anaerobacterium chartisolvens]